MNLLNRIGFCVGLAACALPPVARAAAGQDAAAEAQKIDQQVATLKNEVLELNSRLTAYEQSLLYPAYSRVDVYVAVDVQGFVLTDMSVSIDGEEPLVQAYSDVQSRAFAEGGYHRLLRTNVSQGGHRLRAEFKGHYIDAKPDDPPIQGVVQTSFQKELTAIDIVLPLKGIGRALTMTSVKRLRAPSTLVDNQDQSWKLDNQRVDYRLGSIDDPRVAAAKFWAVEGRYFTALTELLNVADEAGSSQGFSPDYFWQLADDYLSFGLRAQAEAVYDELATGGVDAERMARARLRLAEFEYERAYFPEAERELRAMRSGLPEALKTEWESLMSRVLLAQNRPGEAIPVLAGAAQDDRLTPFMEYNYGVALMRDGRVDQGRNILDRVGRMRPKTIRDLALRDRANTSLGYHFLRNQLGGSAKPVFMRVQVEGPFSNRALLGLGWSELAAHGERQSRVEVGDEQPPPVSADAFSSLGVLIRPGSFDDPNTLDRMQLRPFALGKLDKAQEQALTRALVPWVELSKRNKMDPAVQEGMLAIPYALERLGAHEQSLERYLSAIKTLEEGRRRIDEGLRSIEALSMVETIVRRDVDAETGWEWRLRDLPDLPETYWLTALLAQHSFQESLKNYRDTRLLARRLEAWKERLKNLRSGARAVPPVPADVLIAARRSQDWSPEKRPALRLRTSERLGATAAGVETEGAGRDQSQDRVALALSEPPPQFDGPGEKLAVTVPDIDRLQPLVSALGGRQAAYLQRLGVTELQGQKKQLERYLLEARFSMARIYDQRAKDGASQTEGEQ